jgi:syntaxin 16
MIILVDILQQEQQKRIIPKFDDDENKKIDKKIKELIIDLTNKTQQAEENIKQLNKLNLSSIAEQSIKENMKINLSTKIREFVRQFKLNEETYMAKYRELVGDSSMSDNSSKHEINNGDFLQTSEDFSSDILKKRDGEINTLVKSISDLASIFKDMQTLVIEQGYLL